MAMFRSLRFRLPAFFLAGAVLAGLISTVIALGLFQDYTEDRLVAELRREARGLSILYGEQALRAEAQDRPFFVAPERIEQASGSRWPGSQESSLPDCSRCTCRAGSLSLSRRFRRRRTGSPKVATTSRRSGPTVRSGSSPSASVRWRRGCKRPRSSSATS